MGNAEKRELIRRQQLFAELFEFFRKQLAGDDPAGRRYLRKLGISNATVEAFEIGYSDGKLWSRLNEQRRKQLLALGVLTHNHKDRIGKALVFPARNPDNNAIVDLNVLKLHQNKPANLLDPPEGLLRCDVPRASREVVFTDSVLAALKISDAGWRAVIPLRGEPDLKNNLEFFRQQRPRNIWLATYRNRQTLQPILARLGCTVNALRLPKGDINPERLKRDLDFATEIQSAPDAPSYVEELPDGAVFEHLGCRLRVTGIQESCGGGGLRVILTASQKKIMTNSKPMWTAWICSRLPDANVSPAMPSRPLRFPPMLWKTPS